VSAERLALCNRFAKQFPPPPAAVAQDAPAAALSATFQLSYFCAEQEQYIEVPLQTAVLDAAKHQDTTAAAPGGSTAMLWLIAGEVATAAEWEVSWELPAAAAPGSEAGAAALLHRLRINPQAGSLAAAAATAGGVKFQPRLPPPLAAALTVVLTAESGSLALLAPASLLGHCCKPEQGQQGQKQQQQLQQQQQGSYNANAAAESPALLDRLAVLHAGSLKLAVHTFPAVDGGSLLAVDVSATLALCLPDSSCGMAPAGAEAASAAGRALVESFELDAAVEIMDGVGVGNGGQLLSEVEALHARSPGGKGAKQQQQQQQQQQQYEQQQEAQLFWQAQQQLQELPLLAVRRPPQRHGLSVLLAARQRPLVMNVSESGLAEISRLVAVLSGPSSGADRSASGQEGEGHAAAATDDIVTAAPATAPLLLVNNSGLHLRLRQQGASPAARPLLLSHGQRLPLVWPAPPQLVPGATRRLQLAAAAAAEGDEAAWSAAVEVSQIACPFKVYSSHAGCDLSPACYRVCCRTQHMCGTAALTGRRRSAEAVETTCWHVIIARFKHPILL
jgi:hypothetical protein